MTRARITLFYAATTFIIILTALLPVSWGACLILAWVTVTFCISSLTAVSRSHDGDSANTTDNLQLGQDRGWRGGFNPATGLPMNGLLDIAGNPYGSVNGSALQQRAQDTIGSNDEQNL